MHQRVDVMSEILETGKLWKAVMMIDFYFFFEETYYF